MKLHKFLLAIPLAALLVGCSPVDSLNPLYTDKDVVFDESLLGQWGTEKEGLRFAKLGENGYQMIFYGKDGDSGETGVIALEAHLVSLEEHRFLDVVWKQSDFLDESQNIPEVHLTRTKNGMKIEPRLVSAGRGMYFELFPGESDHDEDRFSMRPRRAHQFFKVVLEDQGKTLKLVQLDDSWIYRQIQEGKLMIDHEIIGGEYAVLTASTPDLQQLVLDHVDDEDAFRGEIVVQRPGSK